MALPIKPKDTQEGCNPISSNCVIWQGPDIPCIKLCTGDSVSDTVAKLADELCTITDQLNISVLDISCFGAVAPEPGNFADVIQILINKTCLVETVLENNGFDLNPNTSTCPDDCLVSVATCLQPNDPLGNVITELPLRDYIILIGTRICTIVAEVNTLTSAVIDLQNRLTTAETEIQNIVNNPTAGQINITSGRCIGEGIEKTIQVFLLDFEEAYCEFVGLIGDRPKITSALNGQCTGLDTLPQLADPRSTMANISGWVPAAQYVSLADAVSNLWRTVCDMREALITLQASNAACCGLTCNDVVWSFTISGIRASKFIDLYFSGLIPAGFDYCRGGGMLITIKDSVGNTGTYTQDVLNAINTGSPIAIDIAGTSALEEEAIWYNISIPLSVCDGTGLECDSVRVSEFYNTNWCEDRGFNLIGTNVVPLTSGGLQLTWGAASTSTIYNISLYEFTGSANVGAVIHTGSVTYSGGARVYTFPGAGYLVANRYQVVVRSQQSSVEFGLKEVSCETSIIKVPAN
jgi:hypothetical protein